MAVLSAVLATAPAATRADCARCEKIMAELAESKAALEKDTEFLGKNRSFLAGLSAKEASKFLKVSGNVTVILAHMDKQKAKISKLETDANNEGCGACNKTKSP